MTAKEQLLRLHNIDFKISAMRKKSESDESGELASALKDCVALKADAVRILNQMQDNLLSGILIEKYINGATWNDIADSLGYEKDYVRKVLHHKALIEYERLSEK